MDPVSLAPVVLSILAPYAKSVAGKLAEKSLEALPDAVGKIGDTVKGKMEAKPETKDLPTDLATAPENKSVQGAFEYQLKKLLENNEAFARRLEALVNDAEKQGAITIQKGGVYIGGNASDNVIITGNNNVVNAEKKKKKR